jgi:hypothetical protein
MGTAGLAEKEAFIKDQMERLGIEEDSPLYCKVEDIQHHEALRFISQMGE